MTAPGPIGPQLTVIVAVGEEDDAVAVCTDLDAQSLPADRFDVVLVSSAPLSDRLGGWVDRRTNVTVAADVESARAGARGSHVVLVAPDDRLFAFGLAELADTVRETGADVVVGVRNDDVRSAQWLTRADTGPSTQGSVLAVRVPSSGDVVAVTPRPVAHAARPGVHGPTTAHTNADQLSVRWSGTRLGLAVTITVLDPDSAHPDSDPAPEGEPAVVLVARGHRVPQERPLPAELTVERTGLDDGWRVSLRADLDLDPRSSVLPGGGRWMPRLRVVWADRELLVPVPGPPLPVPGALLSGRPIAVRSVGGDLQIDQTATTTATVGALRVSDSTLTDSVDGLVLRSDLTDLHVVGAGTLTGQLTVGGQAGPATVGCDDGRAVLVAHVTPGTGRAEIATLFGGPRTPSGLDLELAPDGSCALVPHYREPPFQRPEPVAAEPTARPATPAPTSLPRRAYRSLRRRFSPDPPMAAVASGTRRVR